MISLGDLYKKEKDQPQRASPAPSASTESSVKAQAAEQPPKPAPILETPPGLPQEYIDMNLREQPIPAISAQEAELAAERKPINFRAGQTDTLLNVDNIPYAPGKPPRLVRDRIEQGPRVFVSREQQEAHTLEAEASRRKTPSRPKVIHPDTLMPGRAIFGEPIDFRP